jgi:2-methylcitrate synthase/citrate synthase II
MTSETFSPGLEGVVAGETQLSSVEQNGLFYRGYDIAELATSSGFEESAYLLLYGELPNTQERRSFDASLAEYGQLAPQLLDILRSIPESAPMMDVLRTALSAAGHFDPVEGDDIEAWRQRTMFLAAQTTAIIAARCRLLKDQDPLDPKQGLRHAAQFLYQLNGSAPKDTPTRLLDLTLVLYMEHEFNASTFVARVCASTLSDLVSCVVGGIGTLKGPLHGGANEAAMKMLSQLESAEQARAWTLNALETKQKIMGFGHRVYRNGDHRAFILEDELRRLAEELGEQNWMGIYDGVKDTMQSEKGIFPNVDYPCGLTYHLLGFPADIYTPLFVASRVVGWSGHAIEQHFNNKIIRPRSRYTGPAQRSYVPIESRE